MRPRKRVLVAAEAGRVVERDAMHLHLLVWGYRALDSLHPDELEPDAVVAVHAGVESLRALVEWHRPRPVVALVRREADLREAFAVGVSQVACDPARLREAIATACARKRGPKRQAAAVEQECAA